MAHVPSRHIKKLFIRLYTGSVGEGEGEGVMPSLNPMNGMNYIIRSAEISII
jgi:hypothetical protein